MSVTEVELEGYLKMNSNTEGGQNPKPIPKLNIHPEHSIPFVVLRSAAMPFRSRKKFLHRAAEGKNNVTQTACDGPLPSAIVAAWCLRFLTTEDVSSADSFFLDQRRSFFSYCQTGHKS